MTTPMSELIEGALWWADHGVPVFPCGGNKAPLTENGFKDAVTDPDKVRKLFEFFGPSVKMVGARMGEEAGMFVMDFDLYKGDQPKAYMQHLIDTGALSDSRIHKTLQGGLHVFYYSDKEWPNTKPCPGVEVKGEGGYVIVPPSPGYTVHSDTRIADASDLLLTELHKAREVASSSSINDLKFAVIQATDFHDSLRGIAARLSAQGKDPVDVVIELKKILQASVAADENHSRHGRWLSLMRDKSQELSRMVKSGHDKYNPTAGQEQLSEAVDPKWQETANKLGFFSFPSEGNQIEVKPTPKEYSDDEWPFTEGYFAHEERHVTEQTFTMYPIFAENETVVLFAEPKVGKTAIALTTALHIAAGEDLGAFKIGVDNETVKHKGPCIYYALEGRRAIELRIEAWKKVRRDKNIPTPDELPLWVAEGHTIFLKQETREDEANKIAAANEYARKNWGSPLKAIYLDTLTKAMSGGDQNSVEDTSALFELVGLLRERGVTATIVFVHHKARQGNLRGSSNIEAEPDVLLDVTKEGDLVSLRVARARSIEDGDAYMFRLHGVDLGVNSQGHKIAGVYVEPEEHIDQEEANSLGLSKAHARRLHLIVSMGVGSYRLSVVNTKLHEHNVGPIDRRGNPVGNHQTKRDLTQKFYLELVGNMGTVYQGHVVELERDGQEKIIGVTVSRKEQHGD